MSVDLLAWRDSLINLLDKNNVTASVYDISSGLARRVKYIRGGLPDYGIVNTQLPCIWVRVGEYAEERNTIGESAHRDVNITFEIFPATQYGAGHVSGGNIIADDEAVRLAQNIQDLFRAKNDLSITGMVVNGVDTSFNEEIQESTYVKATKINVDCFKLVS